MARQSQPTLPVYTAARCGIAQYLQTPARHRDRPRLVWPAAASPIYDRPVNLQTGHTPPNRGRFPILALLLILGAQNLYGKDQAAAAQVAGRIVDARSRRPLAQALVTMSGSRDTLLSDGDGRFRADSLAIGATVLEVRAVGYRIARWNLDLAVGRLDLVIEMEGRVPVVDSLAVEGRADRFDDPNNWRSPSAFLRRVQRGNGQFVTPETLRRSQARTLAEILRTVPGVWIACAGHRCEIRLMGSTRPCAPSIYLDGANATNAAGPDFPLQRIMGIEVYRASDAPIELRPLNERCGVVAIWTRMDREPGR